MFPTSHAFLTQGEDLDRISVCTDPDLLCLEKNSLTTIMSDYDPKIFQKHDAATENLFEVSQAMATPSRNVRFSDAAQAQSAAPTLIETTRHAQEMQASEFYARLCSYPSTAETASNENHSFALVQPELTDQATIHANPAATWGVTDVLPNVLSEVHSLNTDPSARPAQVSNIGQGNSTSRYLMGYYNLAERLNNMAPSVSNPAPQVAFSSSDGCGNVVPLSEPGYVSEFNQIITSPECRADTAMEPWNHYMASVNASTEEHHNLVRSETVAPLYTSAADSFQYQVLHDVDPFPDGEPQDDINPDSRTGRNRVFNRCWNCGRERHIRLKVCKHCKKPKERLQYFSG